MNWILSSLIGLLKAPFEIVHIIRNGNRMIDKRAKKKSDLKIFFELLQWLFQYKEVNKYYYRWAFFSKNSEQMKAYVPNKIGQRTVRLINSTGKDYSYIALVRDKFYFGLLLDSLGIPTTRKFGLVNRQKFYDVKTKTVDSSLEHLADVERHICCKPVGGQNGDGVFFIKTCPLSGTVKIKNKEIQLADIVDYFKNGNWLLEEKVIQHPYMEKLNPGSLNTMRITTIYHDGSVKIISCSQRIGALGMEIDNWDRGGVSIRVDKNTGYLDQYGFHKSGKKYEIHPGSQIVYKEVQIPFFKEAIDLVIMTHQFFYGLYTIGWDLAITEEGPIVVEANNNWTLGGIQQVEGGMRDLFENTFWKVAPQLKKI